MPSDLEYLPNYIPDTLYTHPATRGVYATIVAENEVPLGEVEVTSRSRLAVSAFFVDEKKDFGTFKITKLAFHKTHGWRDDGHVQINRFDLPKMRAFISILASIDLQDRTKTKVSLGNIQIDELSTLLNSSLGAQLVSQLSESPELHEDIYAVAAKRLVLREFERNLLENLSEPDWQSFFENNTWIFGHGLNFVFLEGVSKKLEATTTGANFNQSGKRADALLRTRAEVSQYVLVEIKRADTDLLQNKAYRPGCWTVSHELSDAVTQVQKTVFDFARNHFRDRMKDASGNDLSDDVYAIEPQSYLVVGNLSQISGNDDKITCFELYRKNVRAPVILTFDELHQRAKCIVENLNRSVPSENLQGQE